jgi:hypothetical protein
VLNIFHCKNNLSRTEARQVMPYVT